LHIDFWIVHSLFLTEYLVLSGDIIVKSIIQKATEMLNACQKMPELALIPFHVPNIFLPHQHGRSALDTSRTLFLLASTQGVSCRLVMNHLIYMYMFSHSEKYYTKSNRNAKCLSENARKTLGMALMQCHFDCFSSVNKTVKIELHVMQNKIIVSRYI
jgi:hypothetical protein